MQPNSDNITGRAETRIAVGDDASKARITSKELLAGRPEIEIEHDGAVYRLRLTKAGKLILHK
ncbi:hemin uptake protein HemP [Stratiformator vulcanicus]|uniref:Hemin uptake protein hemP n=1 Tax=Stratiformator vulcanicus TaxID=2527980 RepID=A0A517R347_9PLAN|nr:hemin uptake protein HemP [Stratiformator vulcanicus]QDT38302.1 hypothetical protein Pan189_26930 [Stratiformator vulcanicus]